MVDIQELGGSKLASYQLLDCLGHGTHTAVYKAGGSMGSQWALKVVDHHLEPGPHLAERLRRDAALLSQVDHPSILPIYDTGHAGKVTFATTPYLEAPSLEELMRAERLDLELAWNVLEQIADALDRARPLGLCYRLLKPCNVLVDASGRAHLAEFGVTSRSVGPAALATPGYNLRSPEYLAPEQVEGREPNWRADVYALGVLVFELLTRTRLFEGASCEQVLRQTLAGRVPSAHARKPSLPAALDEVLNRALARDPERRYDSAARLLEDLVMLPGEGLMAAAEAPPAPAPAGAAAPAPAPEPVAAGAPQGAESVLTMLHRMGVPTLENHSLPILNSYFACVVRQARELAGAQAPQLLEAAGLGEYAGQDPGADGNRAATAAQFSRLADAFERRFGADAAQELHHLGRAVTDEWMRTTQPKPFRMMGKPEAKVADTLYVFTNSMDRVRGEALHTWKQIDKRQFWVVNYGNLFALGRRRPAKSCHFWTAAYESALRWGGLANDWVVEETECGCVTGSYNCVFTIERVKR